MNWADAVLGYQELRDAYAAVHDLAKWSPWSPFDSARALAPREPGVYLLREPTTHVIRYVGMAGERAGGGRPQGLYGRLSVYWSGKGAVSGFGEAALDRALADPHWVEQQLRDLREQGPKRAKDWARDAVSSFGLEVSWAVTADRAEALVLERKVEGLMRSHGLWNR